MEKKRITIKNEPKKDAKQPNKREEECFYD